MFKYIHTYPNSEYIYSKWKLYSFYAKEPTAFLRYFWNATHAGQQQFQLLEVIQGKPEGLSAFLFGKL